MPQVTEYDDLFEQKGGRVVLIPTASAVDATFRIVHNDLDPSVITRLLMIDPDHTHKKGDSNIDKKGRVFSPYSTGVWLFSSADKLSPPSADIHIQWVLEKLEGKLNQIRNFQNEGYRTEVICYWQAQCFNTCPALSSATIKTLAKFGIDFWFEVFIEHPN